MDEDNINVGTSGWNYEHWKGLFYPKDLAQDAWFDYYQEHFKTVEINNTFYQLPEEETFESWKEQARNEFIYAVKANRYITHMKKLKDPHEPMKNFLSRAEILKENLGPILWQLPPRWHANPERLEDFVQLLPVEIDHVFEFRDPDWFQEKIREILERNEMIFCIHDKEEVGCPNWFTTSTVYLRFHGSQGDYGGRYGKDALRPWADQIRDWRDGGRSIFAYFNNDESGSALKDVKALLELLEA